MTKLVLQGLLAVVLTAGAQAAGFSQEASGDYAKLAVPAWNCTLVNNVWDRKAVPEGFRQSVFLNENGLPGWRWNAPGNRTTVLSMPELVCGDKPWDEPQKLNPMFPFPVLDKHLAATFDIEVEARGRYNLAFSFWAVTPGGSRKADITHEITIWPLNSGMIPEGKKIGVLRYGGTMFDIYLKPDQGVITGPDPFTWKLVSFVARRPMLKGSLDFGIFIDELVKWDILKRGQSLTSLELGDEVAEGSGQVVVKKLSIGSKVH